MKKILLGLVAIVALNILWMGFVREPLPEIPEISKSLSKDVTLDFSIDAMKMSGLELALNEKMEGKGLYVEFAMANVWKTGRPGLVLKGIKDNKIMKDGMSPKEYLKESKGKKKGKGSQDFSKFMEDKGGKSVSKYTFKQSLVEGRDNKTYMRMTYEGPEMEMIQTLEIPRPITLPAHISRQFRPKGIIQFQPGTVALDKKIGGFYIPVIIR